MAPLSSEANLAFIPVSSLSLPCLTYQLLQATKNKGTIPYNNKEPQQLLYGGDSIGHRLRDYGGRQDQAGPRECGLSIRLQ